MEELFLFRIVNVQVPPNSLQREEVNNNDLGRRSPWWGRRQEGTSDHHQCWSQFLVGFIHPVRWHPPDDGRHCALWSQWQRLSSLQLREVSLL